jgi:hypothetical protein
MKKLSVLAIREFAFIVVHVLLIANVVAKRKRISSNKKYLAKIKLRLMAGFLIVLYFKPKYD